MMATVEAKAVDSRDGQEHSSAIQMNRITEAICKIRADSAELVNKARVLRRELAQRCNTE